jgi:tRNA-2-methylthio-N6-dimethylallyladenosine synthase
MEISLEENIDEAQYTIDEPAIGTKKLYIESYGCQMNFADSEIVASILRTNGYSTTSTLKDADLVLLNTCAIRDNAEVKVRTRLMAINAEKKLKPNLKVGVLGCMAERLKHKLLEEEKMVDLVAGPDAYRDLPRLLAEVEDGQKAVNVFLSREETYADISPIRLGSNGVSAYISIMRGCNNMCSFCVVPYTRGRERSRDPFTIEQEAKDLFAEGYKEVILLGQNVDSYHWQNEEKTQRFNFANLLEKIAQVSPELRVRFSTSHPKDIHDDVLYTMKKYENLCKYIHLPVQSGSSRILELMNRGYSREWYLKKIDKIREILGPDCGISFDIITGFCTETEEDHQDTLSLIEQVKYDYGYMFYYSERPGTPAAKNLIDDVSEEIKKRRLQEVIDLQRKNSHVRNQLMIGKTCKILVEGRSKKSEEDYQGRTDCNKLVVFKRKSEVKGQYIHVLITDCTSATLFGETVA